MNSLTEAAHEFEMINSETDQDNANDDSTEQNQMIQVTRGESSASQSMFLTHRGAGSRSNEEL